MAQSIGDQLKQAREQRGMTLEQASKATHIRVYYLEALENDRRGDLPSAVQGRGFLRLYAGHLGLPVTDLLATWEGKAVPEALVILPQEADPIQSGSLEEEGRSEDAEKGRALPENEEAALPTSMNRPGDEAGAELRPTPPLDGSAAIFYEIGQTLRKQREGLGLSQAEVERYTRLRQHYVQALEDGRLDQLPSPVQGRGMLSNYAEFLNMDADKILLRFAEGLQARRIERIPKPDPQGLFNTKKRPARQAPFWRRFLTPDLIFGVSAAAVVLFFIIWSAARINNLRTTEIDPTPLGVSAVLLTPQLEGTLTGTPGVQITGVVAAVSGTDQPAGTTAAGGSGGVTSLTTPTVGLAANGPAGAGAAAPVSQAPTIAPTEGIATLPPMNNDPVQVYIVAHQRAWLHVLVDNKEKFLGRVIPGNAYAFSGSKQIELTTGNAAALQVFYNQNDMGVLGTAGQVVGLVFSPQSVMTPTPAFTPTSTPTKPGTATPLPSPTPQATPTITPYIPSP